MTIIMQEYIFFVLSILSLGHKLGGVFSYLPGKYGIQENKLILLFFFS